MDYSPPGSSVHEIFLARIVEWVAISFSRGSSPPQDQTHVSCIGGFFTPEQPGKHNELLSQNSNAHQPEQNPVLRVKPGLRKAHTFPEKLQKSVLDSVLRLCGVKMNKCHTVLETGLPASGPPPPGPGSSPSLPLSRSWEVPTPTQDSRRGLSPALSSPGPGWSRIPSVMQAFLSMLMNFLLASQTKAIPWQLYSAQHLKIGGCEANMQLLTTISTLANDCVGTFGFPGRKAK